MQLLSTGMKTRIFQEQKNSIHFCPYLLPETTVLDSSKHIFGRFMFILILHCQHDKKVSSAWKGSSYTIIEKAGFCLCSITVGPHAKLEILSYK